MDSAPLVTFLERRDAGAHAALATLRDAFARRGTPARLLRGRQEPDTWLLVVDGDPFAGDAPFPTHGVDAAAADHLAEHRDGGRDVRAWTFVEVREGAA